jgi:hypothetical protein
MRPFTKIFLLLLLLGCDTECWPGESEGCDCGIRSYINYCTNEGFFPECDCYDNGGPEGPYIDQNKDITFWFDGCNENTNSCRDGEMQIPCTNKCWRICPVGMTWTGSSCAGHPYISLYNQADSQCKLLHHKYRFPKLEEVAELLRFCYTDTFNYKTVNYCSQFQDSVMRFIIAPPYQTHFTAWLHTTDPQAAWISRFYITVPLDTEFDWMETGHTAAGGICIRSK